MDFLLFVGIVLLALGVLIRTTRPETKEATPDRIASLEVRLRDLESRLDALEHPTAPATPAVRAYRHIEAAIPPRATRRVGAPAAPASPAYRPIEAAVAESVQEPGPIPSGPGLGERLAERLGLETAGPGEGLTRAGVEAWLEGRMLAVVGGIALLLGAVFFLSVAFSRGWIGPAAQVTIGLVLGAALVGASELLYRRRQTVLGLVLVAVGLAIVSLALLAGARLYALFPVEAGLFGALLASLAAAAIAIRNDSQLVAAFGLVAVLGSPPILGASPTIVTLLFVAVALAGTTSIALFRSWSWLPPLAFVLAAPQLASYVAGGAPVAEGMAALAGFWLINTVAAGGEEFRRPTDTLRSTSVSLLLADAAFLVWAGFEVLSGQAEPWRGTFLTGLAVGHAAVGLSFLRRMGDRHPFGMLVTGTGIAALAMAIPVQLDGPPVPIGWAAEAVALAWVASARRHVFSGAAAIALGSLAVGHLLTIEYPPDRVWAGLATPVPFIGPEGMTLGFLVGAGAVAAALLGIPWIRTWLATVALALVAYASPFELSGAALVATWAALAALAIVVDRRIVAERLATSAEQEGRTASELAVAAVLGLARRLHSAAEPGFRGAALIAGGLAVGHLLLVEFPLVGRTTVPLSSLPFVGPEGLALASVLAALTVVGALVPERWVRLGCAGIGLLLVAEALPFELRMPWLLVSWEILVVVSVAIVRRVTPVPLDRPLVRADVERAAERLPYLAAAASLAGALTVGLQELPVDAFLEALGGSGRVAVTPFLNEPTFCALVVVAAAGLTGVMWGGRVALRSAGAAGLVALAYLLPFELRLSVAIAGWALFAAAALTVVGRDPGGRTILGSTALGILAVGGLVTIGVIAPPDRLLVDATTSIDHPLLLSDASLALGAIALALVIGSVQLRTERWSVVGLGAAAVVVVYLLSVGVVDEFQRRIIGVAPRDVAAQVEELRKQAQTGLSVLWSILGGLAFALGLALRRPSVRLSGLALLGVATVKVFLLDLSYLDVLYRVLSLVALGVLLILSAFLYERIQHPHRPSHV